MALKACEGLPMPVGPNRHCPCCSACYEDGTSKGGNPATHEGIPAGEISRQEPLGKQGQHSVTSSEQARKDAEHQNLTKQPSQIEKDEQAEKDKAEKDKKDKPAVK